LWRIPAHARIELTQLLKGRLADVAVSIGRAVYRVVVDDDELAVAGALHVEFNRVRAQVEGEREGEQGIFRRMAARATMRKDGERLTHGGSL
jgi:hypothetical protein